MLALEVVGGVAGPDAEDEVDALGELLAPVGVEVAEHLPVGRQAAGADAEQEAAFEDVVEHRDLGRDRGRVAVRKVDRARAELDPLRDVGEARQEHGAVRDRLRDVRDVLADVGLREPEPVGQEDRVSVLLQRLHVVALRRVHRHGEVAELDRHSSPFVAETPRTRGL